MKWAVLIVLVCVAAGPATKPTTEDLQTQLADARHAVERAKAAAIDRCHETPEYKSAAADRDAKAKALENARASGSPQGRLDASSAFVKADQAVKRIEAEALAKDQAIAHAEVREESINREISASAAQEQRRKEQASRDAEAKEDADPIIRAMKQGKLAIGMTKDQVLQVFSKRAKDFNSPVGSQIYYNVVRDEQADGVYEQWNAAFAYPGLFDSIYFKDGKVIRILIQ